MPESVRAKARAEPDSGSRDQRPPIDDPDLLREWEALDDPRDREDYLEALESIEECSDDELVPWEDVKAELGY